jgi:hypothetical protein
MARRSTATRTPRTNQRQQRRDQIHEEGGQAALAGKTEDEMPLGLTPFPNGYELQERSDWLWGLKAGWKELDALAAQAVHALASSNPVAIAALQYAAVEQETRTLRDPIARAEAARVLVDALLPANGHGAAQDGQR